MMKNYLVQNVLALLLEHPKLAFYISAQGDPLNLFLKWYSSFLAKQSVFSVLSTQLWWLSYFDVTSEV